MQLHQKLGSLAFAIPLVLFSTQANSAGFALIENAGSGMGSAFAGASAEGKDASTVWFNPAGMSLIELDGHSVVSQVGHIILPSSDFKNKRSRVNPALTGGDVALAEATLTGKGDDAGKNAFVPNLYYVKPINDKLRFGLGINAPFGLEVTYDDDWIGRYHATNSEMKTVNLNPSISWKASDRLTLGGGINAQYIEVTLGTKIDSGAACRSAASAANSGTLLAQCLTRFPKVGQSATDSNVEVSGDDFSFGFNLGLLYQPTNKTRIGVSYRSGIKHKLEGEADFTVDDSLALVATSPTTNLQQVLGATRLADRDIRASASLPESASFSIAHKATNKIELLADATWTGWSSFDELRILDKAGATVAVTPEEWEDVWRLSVGGTYQYNDKLALRTGIAYDESPVPGPKLRTPRLPGNDRTWLSFGANYKINKRMDVDVGYSHLFIDDTPIDNTDENGYNVSGIYESDVDILSTQINFKF